MQITNYIRQHPQNSGHYYIQFTIKILQLQHVSTLFGSSSGSTHKLSIKHRVCLFTENPYFAHIIYVHSLKVTQLGSKHFGVVIF